MRKGFYCCWDLEDYERELLTMINLSFQKVALMQPDTAQNHLRWWRYPLG